MLICDEGLIQGNMIQGSIVLQIFILIIEGDHAKAAVTVYTVGWQHRVAFWGDESYVLGVGLFKNQH